MSHNDESFIDALLYEAESDALDFKRDQYPFRGASEDDKSELLKDILALANSWRRTDGYLLIGVEEVKGGKSVVVGIQADLSDANLQQFVNSKTYAPLTFSYRSLAIGGNRIGIIHVPLQARPHSLRQDFGKLRRNTVYIRRGSSTDEASPAEIVQMGIDQRASAQSGPAISVHLGDAANRSLLDDGRATLKVACVNAPVAAEIPAYTGQEDPPFQHRVGGYARQDFYRELIYYYLVRKSVAAVGFAVRNEGERVAENVTVEFNVPDAANELWVLTDNNIPDWPEPRTSVINLPGLKWQNPVQDVGDIVVHRLQDAWQVLATFGRVRPRETLWTENRLWLGAPSSRTLMLPGRVLADNLPMPPTVELQIAFDVNNEDLSIKKAERLYAQELLAEMETR